MQSPIERYLSERSDTLPKWLDNDRFTYLTTRSGSLQIWEYDLKDGSERQRTFGLPVQTCRVCSASREYLYTVEYDGNERQQPVALGFGETEPKFILNRPKADHSVAGLSKDGRFLYYLSNARHPRWHDVCVYDRKEEKETILFQNDELWMCSADGLSPDGRYVAFHSLRNTHVESRIYLTDTQSGATKVLFPEKEYALHQLSWAPDGRGFYCCQNIDADMRYVGYYDTENGTFRPVYRNRWNTMLAVPSPDGSRLAVVVNEDGCSKLLTVDPLSGQELKKAPLRPGVMRHKNFAAESLSWSPDGKKILFPFSAEGAPARIFCWEPESGALTQITKGLDKITMDEITAPSLEHYTSFDGLTIPYWLYLPKGKAARNLPLLIEIHGGPAGQLVNVYNEYIQYLVSQGIAVAAPNIRGSAGYGVKYCQLDDKEKRLDTVKDIECLARHLLDSGLADPAKMVVSGTSYGGFMTLSCAARMPKLWACAVGIVGMFNLVSFLENTSEFRRASRETEYGFLATDRKMLYDVSPIAKVNDIVCPLMVVHGANDPRVPVTETEQVVAHLKALGRDVTYLRYEDEGHGVAKRHNRIDCYTKIAAFIQKHLDLPDPE